MEQRLTKLQRRKSTLLSKTQISSLKSTASAIKSASEEGNKLREIGNELKEVGHTIEIFALTYYIGITIKYSIESIGYKPKSWIIFGSIFFLWLFFRDKVKPLLKHKGPLSNSKKLILITFSLMAVVSIFWK